MAKGAATDIEQDAEDRAFLVFANSEPSEDAYVEAELEGLCEAAGIKPVASLRQRLDHPYKSTFLGTGKLDELKMSVLDSEAQLVIVDDELSGIQVRNLEEAIGRRVVDRTQLILDIFARRARTREGHLQVELAQLTYMLPRLMSVYTKFERQKGGIGMRGPGEMKLETDRRLARDKIARLKEEIEDVAGHRRQQRSGRRKHPFPFAAIVGYTSAGKSTLMNRLSGTDLLADAMPFATLDPTTRKVDLPDGYSLFLTDTVGFIRNLPTHLVAAFQATLEEVTEADFLLHIVDVSSPQWDVQRDAVLETLDLLGAGNKRTLTVFNKADLAEPDTVAKLVDEWPDSVAISALTGKGMDSFLEELVRLVRQRLAPIRALVPYASSALVDECYRYGRVHKVEYRDDAIFIDAELVSEMRSKLERFSV